MMVGVDKGDRWWWWWGGAARKVEKEVIEVMVN